MTDRAPGRNRVRSARTSAERARYVISPCCPRAIHSWMRDSSGSPVAGATHEKEMKVGIHPLQLYSLATPNGVKVTVMLEELLALGHKGAEYDAWITVISNGDQFASGFVAINPNSKIPALMDRSGPTPIRVFESGAILVHLAEKFGAFLPAGGQERAECLSWLFWQMGSAPFLGGGFGHFYAYAPTKIEYAIDRYAMEVKRQLDVLDRRLAESPYLAGDEYTIADIAIFPWLRSWKNQGIDWNDYPHLKGWFDEIGHRPAVQRGVMQTVLPCMALMVVPKELPARLLPAAASLALFAWLLTLHPTASGRVYAAYGGVYIGTALFWLWLVDGIRPCLLCNGSGFAGLSLILKRLDLLIHRQS